MSTTFLAILIVLLTDLSVKAELSDVFYIQRSSSGNSADFNYEILLRGCNAKLTEWSDIWHGEMNKSESPTATWFTLLN